MSPRMKSREARAKELAQESAQGCPRASSGQDLAPFELAAPLLDTDLCGLQPP